jgi:hypothetical protein
MRNAQYIAIFLFSLYTKPIALAKFRGQLNISCGWGKTGVNPAQSRYGKQISASPITHP